MFTQLPKAVTIQAPTRGVSRSATASGRPASENVTRATAMPPTGTAPRTTAEASGIRWKGIRLRSARRLTAPIVTATMAPFPALSSRIPASVPAAAAGAKLKAATASSRCARSAVCRGYFRPRRRSRRLSLGRVVSRCRINPASARNARTRARTARSRPLKGSEVPFDCPPPPTLASTIRGDPLVPDGSLASMLPPAQVEVAACVAEPLHGCCAAKAPAGRSRTAATAAAATAVRQVDATWGISVNSVS